jgi:F-type H+-transporting ATPase subunit gamma
MELIAASRIVRAQQRIVAARPYVERLRQMTADVAAAPGPSDLRLLEPPDPAAACALVVVAADRGLCGAYNSSVLRAAEAALDGHARAGRAVRLVVVGRRAVSYLRFRGHRIDHAFTGMTDRPTAADSARLAEVTSGPFGAEDVGLVELVSTRFLSLGSQRVEVHRLLPLSEELLARGRRFDYELEPDRPELLDALGRRLVEAELHLALLEAAASEHAARQRAMKAATDNADDLITTLRRVMNRARQDAITTEIMDIVGGAEALRRAEEAEEEGGGPAAGPHAA